MKITHPNQHLLEQGVKYVTTCSSVSIVNFEHTVVG